MKQPVRNQRGFGVIEILLIAVIVLGLGGIGWYVVSSNHKTQNQLDSLAKSSDTTNKANSSTTVVVKKAGDLYIFKELGLQMKLPAGLEDLTYTAQQITSVTGEKTTAIYLSSKSYDKDVAKCYNEPANGASFGAIGKTNGQYPSDPSPENVDGGLLKQFNTFYVSLSYPNGITTCENTSVDSGLAQSQAHKLSTIFSDAFKNSGAEVQ